MLRLWYAVFWLYNTHIDMLLCVDGGGFLSLWELRMLITTIMVSVSVCHWIKYFRCLVICSHCCASLTSSRAFQVFFFFLVGGLCMCCHQCLAKPKTFLFLFFPLWLHNMSGVSVRFCHTSAMSVYYITRAYWYFSPSCCFPISGMFLCLKHLFHSCLFSLCL